MKKVLGKVEEEKGESSSSDENSVAALFPHCKEAPARLCFKWLDIEQAATAFGGVEEAEASVAPKGAPFVNPLAFQRKNFDNSAYFRAIEKTQTRESLFEAGFRSLRDIDNTYEILVEDIDDLMSEIDLQRQRHEGVQTITDLML